jgi:predicted RNase H-like HicB family nuclease
MRRGTFASILKQAGKAVEIGIRDAIRFHIDGLKEDGLPVPAPTSIADYVEA